jgi:hypothetical protein
VQPFSQASADLPDGTNATQLVDSPDGTDATQLVDLPDGTDATQLVDLPDGTDATQLVDLPDGTDATHLTQPTAQTCSMPAQNLSILLQHTRWQSVLWTAGMT